ncbi:DUF3606 domain-containing protein [Variovorax sp. J22P271]|uniref:DUF3606 domain-containing protein n=1 Tax=Variovorax davisae TaxID=3053515 RepID=UPI002574E231|nr:DUF3606 domain-containing protein [Variovorax sp. J22P271]MDM0032183.1 DUF3606 domain-containing protein [Variovorax sp. J22P271]
MMDHAPHRVLRLLQEASLVQVLYKVGQIRSARGDAEAPAWDPVRLAARLAACRQELLLVQPLLPPDVGGQIRVGRSLFLRMLLASAPRRMAGWSAQVALSRVPLSQFHEWLSNDIERAELEAIESAMTAQEASLYGRLGASELSRAAGPNRIDRAPPDQRRHTMPDEMLLRSPLDSTQIDVCEEDDIRYWTAQLHITEEKLRLAVAAVGVAVADVKGHLVVA